MMKDDVVILLPPNIRCVLLCFTGFRVHTQHCGQMEEDTLKKIYQLDFQ